MRKYLIGKVSDSGKFLPLRSATTGRVLTVETVRACAFQRVARTFQAVHGVSDEEIAECTMAREMLHSDTVVSLTIEGMTVSAPAGLLNLISSAFAYAASGVGSRGLNAMSERFSAAGDEIFEVLRAKGYYDDV